MFCPRGTENLCKGPGLLTKITKYRTEGRKRATAHTYRRKIRSALLSLTRNVILCNTPEHVDAACALAQAISGEGMNNRNYLLFLTLLETNNPSVIDILVGPRNPFLLFSPIKPNWFLVKETFRILAKFKGNELAVKVLLALLGVIQNAYKTSKDGNKIYPLRMSDVYNIGKHLDKDRDQLDPRNRLLLEILFDIYFVGIDSDEPRDEADRHQGERHPHGVLRQHEETAGRDPGRAAGQGHRARAPGAPLLPVGGSSAPAPRLSKRREEPEVKVGLQKRRAELARARRRKGRQRKGGRARRARGASPKRLRRSALRHNAAKSAKRLTTGIKMHRITGAAGLIS